MPFQLKSPLNEQASIQLPREVSDLSKPFNGTICSSKGDEYQIRKNIIDILGNKSVKQTLAQASNHLPITASVYEDYWRKKSIGILSGEEFTLDRERKLLLRWLNPKPNMKYLDIGCSSGFYARSIQQEQSDAETVALDIAMPMLRETRKRAISEQLPLYLMRANAAELPFFTATFDGIVCGGTLNELSDPLKVLYETKRVIKPGAVAVFMHLLKAESIQGKILQKTTGLGGITYWTLDESNGLFERAGFTITQQMRFGIVCFSRLTS